MSQESPHEKIARVAAIEIVAMQLFAMENDRIYTWALNDDVSKERRSTYRQRAIELLAEAMS